MKKFTESTKIKIFLVGRAHSYASWINNYEFVADITKADLVFFTGGEDINPKLYNEKPHKYTSSPSQRDNLEIEAFNEALKHNIKCWGTCRGIQLLCALSGGKLVQHMSHPHQHHIYVTDSKDKQFVYLINSLHHQLQYPFDMPPENYKIIGWSNNISPFNWLSNDKDIGKMPFEPEIVYYPKTNSLGAQCHPEMMSDTNPFVKYLNNLLLKFLNNEIKINKPLSR